MDRRSDLGLQSWPSHPNPVTASGVLEIDVAGSPQPLEITAYLAFADAESLPEISGPDRSARPDRVVQADPPGEQDEQQPEAAAEPPPVPARRDKAQ